MPEAGAHPGWALDLLAGDRRSFIDDHWGREILRHRTDPEPLVDLFSLAAADELLTASAIRTPSVRLVQDGSVLPESRYTRPATLAGRSLTGLVDPRKALELFDAGATIVFQGLHRYWPSLTRLVADLELALGHPCQANAYLTPPSAQGFAVHADTHDVFVFQTHGRKVWELPGPEADDAPPAVPADADTAGNVTNAGPREQIAEAVNHERTVDAPRPAAPEQVVLEPGLVLYLPTGTRHAARAQDAISLHVTIGINQLTWRGLLRRSVDALLNEVPDGHLPAGHLDDPQALREGLANRLAALADELRTLEPDELVRTEQQRFLTTRPRRLAGGLLDRDTEIDDHTPLRRRGICLPQPPDGDRMRVLLGDRSLEVPAWLAPAFDRLAGLSRFTPADLAEDLDEPSRLVLCRRLIREGTLSVDTRDAGLSADRRATEGHRLAADRGNGVDRNGSVRPSPVEHSSRGENRAASDRSNLTGSLERRQP